MPLRDAGAKPREYHREVRTAAERRSIRGLAITRRFHRPRAFARGPVTNRG
jgi:hypothetical protein